jgi:ADP-ribose pyrophosphatase YjhB (NUDIX family)
MVGQINKLALTVAYSCLRGWKKLTKSPTRGAAVAVWYKGKILVVRHSYRPGFSLPGGQLKRNESPASAAARELSEEVGIQVDMEQLVPVHRDRSGHSLFEYSLETQPIITIDNREVIDARLIAPAEITDPDDKLDLYLRGVVRNTYDPSVNHAW